MRNSLIDYIKSTYRKINNYLIFKEVENLIKEGTLIDYYKKLIEWNIPRHERKRYAEKIMEGNGFNIECVIKELYQKGTNKKNPTLRLKNAFKKDIINEFMSNRYLRETEISTPLTSF